jgi:hypothetical protein
MLPNNAIDGDTAESPLRAPYGARHRGRYMDDRAARQQGLRGVKGCLDTDNRASSLREAE